MLRKIFPLVLALIGLGAGVGAGVALRPAPEEVVMTNPCGEVAAEAGQSAEPKEDDTSAHDYVKLNNQFVVPVVESGRIGSLVVLSLSLEVDAGQTEAIYQREPKLRDMFLQVMFEHANAGGFSGSFTNSIPMAVLRNALREAARKALGPIVTDVLIMDIVRQDA